MVLHVWQQSPDSTVVEALDKKGNTARSYPPSVHIGVLDARNNRRYDLSRVRRQRRDRTAVVFQFSRRGRTRVVGTVESFAPL